MQSSLAKETLKSGVTMEIESVLAPDAARADQIRPFLGHKPENYRGHIDAALADECDSLETRFYLGLIDGQVVGNIMTVEKDGVGLLGHVHTREDQRRKGICTHIMRYQMEDFRQRGGHVLLLGTGYQSAAYRIYESFGFRDWKVGKPGLMRYAAPGDEDFETRRLRPAPACPCKALWAHWPHVALLGSVPQRVHLRNLALGLWGPQLLEGPFCRFLYDRTGNPDFHAGVLETESGAVLAAATLVPDTRWKQDVFLLDVFGAEGVGGAALVTLIESLPAVDLPIRCYADPRDSDKITALQSVGFEQVARHPRQFRQDDNWHEAWLYARY